MPSFRLSSSAFRGRVAIVLAANVLACAGLNATDVVPWKVVPDATRIAFKIRARSGSLGVPAPGAAGTAIYPSTTSPFVVITNHGQGAQLWNLETGKTIGGKFGHVDDPAATLSPDGQWIVAEHFENGQRYSAVWSTKTGQRVWTAPTPHHISPRRDFGGDTEIVEVTAKNIWIWDFRSNRKVREIEAATSSFGLPHYSPTRKYLVRPESNGLRLYDLTYGDLVGQLAFPGFAGLELKLAELDWSDDGKELAAVFRTSRDKASRIDDAWAVASWSMKDGSLVAQHAIGREVIIALNPYAAPLEIDCLPDHDGWWVRNVAMIDRKSGKVVWTLPEPKNVRPPTYVLADGRLLVNWTTGGSPPMWLMVVEAPRKLIEQRVASLRARPKQNQNFIDAKKDDVYDAVDWGAVHARANKLRAVPRDQRGRLTDAQVRKLLAQVRSNDVQTMEAAVEQLGGAKPAGPLADEVAKAVREIATQRLSGFIIVAGFWVADEWDKAPTMPATTRDQRAAEQPVPGLRSKDAHRPGAEKLAASSYAALAVELKSGDLARMQAAFNKLVDSRDPSAAELIVKHRSVHAAMANTSLMRMGEVAAPAITKLLSSPEISDRQMGLTLLRMQGTQEQLPAIDRLIDNDPNAGIRLQAKSTADKIRQSNR